jgi:hypothetical protein
MSAFGRAGVRSVALLLTAALISPSLFAQGAAPPAPPPPSATPATPSTGPFTAPLSETLTGTARGEYEAGKLLYNDGDYGGAALKFMRAYDESKDPRLLWNAAAAEKNLRRYVRVADLVGRYMTEGGDRLTAEELTEAKVLLDTVRAFISDVTFKIVPDGATIIVDEQPIGVSPLPGPVQIEMGQRRLKVSKPGYQDFSAAQSFTGGAATSVEISLQQVIHEGKLRIIAGPGDVIRVDGKVVGTGEWEGTLPSGAHSVAVTGEGKRAYQSEAVVQDNQGSTLRIALDPESGPGGGSDLTWLWVAGGAVAAAGLGVGAYFMFRPEDEGPPPPILGTLNPGAVPLSF